MSEVEKKERVNIQKILAPELDRLKLTVAKFDKGEAIMRALYFVEQGAITQEQANEMVANAEKRALSLVQPLTADEETDLRHSIQSKVEDYFKEEKKETERYSFREAVFALYTEGKDCFDEAKSYAEKLQKQEYYKEQHKK